MVTLKSRSVSALVGSAAGMKRYAVLHLLVWALTTGWANAALVLDLKTGGLADNGCQGGCSASGVVFGWGFDLSSAIQIDGLGVWDANSNGLEQPSVQVGLWKVVGPNHNLLTSATITATSGVVGSASANGRWLFENVTRVTLDAGTYRIGALFFQGLLQAQLGASYTTIAGLTFSGGYRSYDSGGFSAPTGPNNLPIFGPTMRLAGSESVPEPGTLALLSLSLGAMGLMRRRKHA